MTHWQQVLNKYKEEIIREAQRTSPNQVRLKMGVPRQTFYNWYTPIMGKKLVTGKYRLEKGETLKRVWRLKRQKEEAEK